MPYPNEHAARQLSPRMFADFRRKSWGKGISVIYGIPGKNAASPSLKVQALRFDARIWTVKRAQAWLRSHNFKSTIEPATRTTDLSSVRSHLAKLRKRLHERIAKLDRKRA